MDARSRNTFLALVGAQAAHSIEECVFRLYDVFAPARLVASLISSDPARGFLIGNVVLVLFGLLCYFVWVRPNRPSAALVAWFWALLELGNGIGHPLIAVARGSYFPGAATAPLLLGLSIYLMTRLSADAAPAHD
jgi:hypothetical protein